jgi:dTDP-glucose pyrophosphorylase
MGLVKQVLPSLEVTDLNRVYLGNGSLNVTALGKGYVRLNTSTMGSLYMEEGELACTV